MALDAQERVLFRLFGSVFLESDGNIWIDDYDCYDGLEKAVVAVGLQRNCTVC